MSNRKIFVVDVSTTYILIRPFIQRAGEHMELEATLVRWRAGEGLPDDVSVLADIHECNSWHDETVYQHTINVVDELQRYNKNPALTLVAWLHDIGKARTLRREGEQTKFPGHEEHSALMAQPLIERLLDSSQKKYAQQLIRYHGVIHEMAVSDNWRWRLEMLHANGFPVIDLVSFGYIETITSRLSETKPENYQQRVRCYFDMASLVGSL